MAQLCSVVLGVGLALSGGSAVGAPVSPDQAFAKMRALVGNWEAKTAKGSVIRVNYRLLSSESVLLQTYGTPSGRETLTLFHMDGPSLIATHYCAQGNQPRLRLERSGSDQSLDFLFFDATNLPDARASHLHRLQLDFVDSDQLNASETYRSDGKDATDVLRFTLVH
jgi:hypothetical protein